MAGPTPIPPRPKENVESGRSFIQRLRGLSSYDREVAIRREFSRGNVPTFMRPENFWEISVEGNIEGRHIEIRFRFCRDYAAIGNDRDSVRVPMSPLTAQRIADAHGFALPTRTMVDLIEQRAKLSGQYLPFHAAPEIARGVIDPATGNPVSKTNFKDLQHYSHSDGQWMMNPRFAEEQNRLIEADVNRPSRPDEDDAARRRRRLGVRSGHKKDIVYHPDVVKRHAVAIYHEGIQPLSTLHGETYQDYSHGVRFILDQEPTPGNRSRYRPATRVIITEANGDVREVRMSIADILNHPEYYRLISNQRMDIRQMYRSRFLEEQHTTMLDTAVPTRVEPEIEPPPQRARRV